MAMAQQQQQQQQQRYDKSSPPNSVIASQHNLVDPTVAALQYQAAMAAAANQQGLLSRHPGKVAPPYGGDIAPPPPPPHIQSQLHNFQQQFSKAQGLAHSQQQQHHGRAAFTAVMQPHYSAQTLENTQQQQQQQVSERQHREMGADSTKSGLSISATPFIPNSQPHSGTPPSARKFTAAANHNAGEGAPPPPLPPPVSAVAVAAGHVTRPLLHQVIVPSHHVVATPPAGMLPLPRQHTQQLQHVANTAQFQHPTQRKTSASSAPPPQGHSILGGPAYQIIDKQLHAPGSIHRQHSGDGTSGSVGKPPPGLSLPIRQNVMAEQGSTPSVAAPGLVMAGLDLAARTMTVNRSGQALVNTAPMSVGGGFAVRPQHPHIPELSSLYGAPPKLPTNMSTTGGNKRALLPTPTAAGPIPNPLGYLPSAAHHHIATPTPSVPPGWPGGSVRVPPHRVPPPSTNPSGHRQTVIFTQEQQQQQQQVVQRSNYTGGGYTRGNGAM